MRPYPLPGCRPRRRLFVDAADEFGRYERCARRNAARATRSSHPSPWRRRAVRTSSSARPRSLVIPSRSMMSTASAASHRYVRTSLPPAAVYGSRNDCRPPTWKSGNVSSVASGVGAGRRRVGSWRGHLHREVHALHQEVREVALGLDRALRLARRAGRVHDRRVGIEIDLQRRGVGRRRRRRPSAHGMAARERAVRSDQRVARTLVSPRCGAMRSARSSSTNNATDPESASP